MPTAPRGLRRITWYSCLVGSVGLAVAGVATAPSAGASSTPKFTYSSTVGAIGVQTALFSSPEPSSVPDLTDVQTPSSDAQLDSFGTSLANGHVGNLNGLGVLPSLICLASSQFCNAIPIGTLTGGNIKNFPPADPLDAQSTYPAQQQASAPKIGKKDATVKTNSGPFKLAGGQATSSATATATTTDAQDGNMSLLGGMSIGSVHTSTRQSATPGSLITQATSQVSDINIGTGHLLHIGSVLSKLQIVSTPNKPATDTASSVVSGVTVLGKSATIDGKGVHVQSGPKVPKSVASAYQKVLDTVFKKAGLNVQKAAILRHTGHSGHSVAISGVEMFYKHTVKGVPPLSVGFPPGVPCPIKSPLPVDPCAGVGLNLNAKYRGQITLGQVGALSLALPPTPTPKVPPVPASSTPPVSSGTPGGTVGGTGSTGSGVAGGSTGGVPASGSTATSAGQGSAAAPEVAQNPQAFSDPFGNLSGRLWWFFPLIALSLLAIAGRFQLPARLPSRK